MSTVDRTQLRNFVVMFAKNFDYATAQEQEDALNWLDSITKPSDAETKLAQIEALLDDETLGDHLYPEDVRAILRGDQ